MLLSILGFALLLLIPGAIVTGPLFSLTASGQIAKALVYSTWKGRAYVREYVVGANPNTLAQRTRRAFLGFISKMWANLSGTDQDSWVTGASAKNISPFNEFVGQNMDRQTNELGPSGNSTPAGGALTGTINTVAATGGVGKIDVTLTNTTDLGAGEYNMVCISDTSFADAQSTLNSAYFGLEATSDQTLSITDLDPGTYWISGAIVNEGGTISTFVDASSSVTVT